MSTPTSTPPVEPTGAKPAEWWDSRPGASRRVGVLEALRRYWFVALIPTVLLAALGAAYGHQRTPTYTATSRLIVGGLALNTPGAQAGFATAVQGLAEAYSRAVTADEVLQSVATDFNTTPEAIRANLNGTPLQGSPVFTITGRWTNERGAVKLANDSSQALLSYLERLYGNNPATRRLSRAYERASRAASEKAVIVRTRRDAYDAKASPANRDGLVRAQAQADRAVLDQQALADQYRAAAGSNVGASTIVEVLSAANVAQSDQRATTQKFGVIGLIAGAILGLGAALALANRARRRA